MKKFALLVVSLFVAGSASYARKPAPVIPDFIHAAYSVESLLSEAELTNPGYDAFQFIYLMATPEWAGLDFDRPQDAVDAYATQFDYLKQGGKMALVPSMIEKAHAAGARILLCFGGQQEFLPLLENPDRIPRFVGYMVRLVEKNGYDGIDMDWEITLDKETQHYKAQMALKFAELVYNGQWYTPLRKAMSAFVKSTQEAVTGDVTLKLYKGNIMPVSVTSLCTPQAWRPLMRMTATISLILQASSICMACR